MKKLILLTSLCTLTAFASETEPLLTYNYDNQTSEQNDTFCGMPKSERFIAFKNGLRTGIIVVPFAFITSLVTTIASFPELTTDQTYGITLVSTATLSIIGIGVGGLATFFNRKRVLYSQV